MPLFGHGISSTVLRSGHSLTCKQAAGATLGRGFHYPVLARRCLKPNVSGFTYATKDRR